ncbi:MAG TPA: sigma-70 family RNA polymerase sigma factor [Planctomycetota bacterium]
MTALDVQNLLAAEPFVRSLARSLLAEDADEVVQQVWLKALRREGPRVRDLKQWLAQVVRSVAANMCRATTRRRRHETAAAGSELACSSLRLCELEERRRSLLAAVDALPHELRTVLLMRFFDGLPPRVIARRLGEPVAVVWRRQQHALAMLREQLDIEAGGDRSRWHLALLPLAGAPRGLPWRELTQPATPVFWTGVLAMTKTWFCGAAIVLAAIFLLGLCTNDTPPDATATTGAREPARSVQADLPAVAALEPASPAPEREAAPAPEAREATGNVVVRVRYADDKSPASGVVVFVWPADQQRVFAARRVSTGEDGVATIAELRPGRVLITTDRGLIGSESADIRAGETSEATLELAGVPVTGVVIDGAGTPVAGALVETMPPLATRPELLAVTGPDGSFRVRAMRIPFILGARAAGLSASESKAVLSETEAAGIRLVLGPAGGVVEGRVTGWNGPCAAAIVQVGNHPEPGLVRNAPLPAVVRCDDEGRFRAVGLGAGAQPVQVRARGFAPWRGTCEVSPGVTSNLEVQLVPGATIRGHVRAADGTAVAEARLGVGDFADLLAWSGARSDKNGLFVLTDLPAGPLELLASHEHAGKASRRVDTTAGEVTACDLQLSRGLELRGRVVREDGAPVSRAEVICWWRGGNRGTSTDALGRFTIANCLEGSSESTVTVSVGGPGIEELRQASIDPRAGEAELRVRAIAAPSARLTGTFVDPAGRPMAGLTVLAGREGRSVTERVEATTGADGRFAFGPLVPGRWYLHADGGGHAKFLGRFELAADAAHDAGTLQLVAGGRLRVGIVAGDPAGVQFLVQQPEHAPPAGPRDRAAASVDLQLGASELLGQQITPGDDELVAYGNGTAEQTLPFTIRADEETRLELRLERGVRQLVEVLVAAEVRGEPIEVLVQRGDRLVRRKPLGTANAEKRKVELWLARGDYSLVAQSRSRRAEATFRIGAEEGPPVRVELR